MHLNSSYAAIGLEFAEIERGVAIIDQVDQVRITKLDV
jgi:hypothetical protein